MSVSDARLSMWRRPTKERAEAAGPMNQEVRQTELMEYLASQSRRKSYGSANPDFEDTAILPCYYVPLPPILEFYGREDILAVIANRLDTATPSGRPQSTALWAAAGVGKTQIALAYANRKRAQGIKVILWVTCEDESRVMKSFTEIAQMLRLSGATSSKGHDQNRLLVLRWLHETETEWLLILDNVSHLDLSKMAWPSQGRGSILVTCRSKIIAVSSAASYIEVPTFSDEESCALLMKQLRYTVDPQGDVESSRKFSKSLGGHALAINLMARHIRYKYTSLTLFVKSYEENHRAFHKLPESDMMDTKYNKGLDSVWTIVFSQLTTKYARILGILSMLGPDRIPSSIIDLRGGRTFLTDIKPNEHKTIIIELSRLGLINPDEDFQTLSVHRLIQCEFREHLTAGDQKRAFREAAIILRTAFPQLKKAFVPFTHWIVCESLIEHVQVLCDRFHELATIGDLEYVSDFVHLTSDASRYLLEIGRYSAALEVVSAGFRHCKDTRLEYSDLCVIMATILHERGQDKAALAYNKNALQIRQKLLNRKHSEIANALSDYALSLVGAGQNLGQALEMLLKALKIDTSYLKEDRDEFLRLRHCDLYFAYRSLGDFEKARRELNLAEGLVKGNFGENSRYPNILHRFLLEYECRKGDYDLAYSFAEDTLTIAKKDAATTPWVSTSLYKLGCIRLLQNRPAEALEHLTQALLITRHNEREKGDKGDTARVLHKYAEALLANGEREISESVRAEAEEMYQELVKTGKYTVVEDEEKKWEFLVCLKWR